MTDTRDRTPSTSLHSALADLASALQLVAERLGHHDAHALADKCARFAQAQVAAEAKQS